MFHFYAVFHGNSLKIVKTVSYYVDYLVKCTIVLKAINAIVNYWKSLRGTRPAIKVGRVLD